MAVKCEACENTPINGTCWRCLDCKSTYNMCTSCYMSDEHDKDHAFERIDKPGLIGYVLFSIHFNSQKDPLVLFSVLS